jgi:ABC-type lipoprotein export system ATPase subunit
MNIINKNNFIIIDEGFSAMDEKNINNTPYLFDILKKDYDICIIITHINEIKIMNERKIEITKNEKTLDSNIYIK